MASVTAPHCTRLGCAICDARKSEKVERTTHVPPRPEHTLQGQKNALTRVDTWEERVEQGRKARAQAEKEAWAAYCKAAIGRGHPDLPHLTPMGKTHRKRVFLVTPF
jgi:hypothetical protein